MGLGELYINISTYVSSRILKIHCEVVDTIIIVYFLWCFIWWPQILWRRKISDVTHYYYPVSRRYQNYRISFVDEEVNDKCWKYSVSQLSQITPSGGSQDNWFVIILAVTWGTSSQVIETVAFLRFLILYHHFYSELRPDPRKCLQVHNKQRLEWNGKKDVKNIFLFIWNFIMIDKLQETSRSGIVYWIP